MYFESKCVEKGKAKHCGKKQPAPNGRFGSSEGVSRPTLECRTATSALVQTAVESPACRQAAGTLWASRDSAVDRDDTILKIVNNTNYNCMRNIILVTLVASLTLIKVYGQEPSQIIVPNHNDTYSKYVQMLENGETDIDYQDFRFSFLESEQFLIASKKSEDLNNLKKRMYAEMDKSNYREIVSITQQMLTIDYTNMLAHKILRQTYNILGDTLNAQKYKAIQFGLMHSILDRGNGKMCETAWPVIQISEEYFILNIMGAEFTQQSLYNEGGLCDEMDVMIEGEKKTYYFEVSKVFEGYNKKGLK